jgi:hypothetical protein
VPCSASDLHELSPQVLREADDWPGLNEHILLLAKRRSQLKQAVQAFVRQAMGYVDEAPDEAARVELIKTLQSVTEGKASAAGRLALCPASQLVSMNGHVPPPVTACSCLKAFT